MFKSGSITVSYHNTYLCFQCFPLAIHLRKELDHISCRISFIQGLTDNIPWCLVRTRRLIWFWFRFFPPRMLHWWCWILFLASLWEEYVWLFHFGDLKIDWWAPGVSCPIRFLTHLPPNSFGNHWWLLVGSIISLGVAKQGFSDPIRPLCHLWFFYKELKWDRWDIYF